MSFKLIRPIAVTDAVLVSSNVPATDHAAWSSGTSYAVGARAQIDAANVHDVYESLTAANIAHNPTTDDGTNWVLVGSTNKWAMFDAKLQSQTVHADSIAVTLQPGAKLDTVAALNVSGLSARIVITDPFAGVVRDQTISLVSNANIIDVYDYLFEEVIRKTDVTFDDLPPYPDATIAVTIDEPGANVACGVLIPGSSRVIGATQYGVRLGIVDYSVKSIDDFGNYVVVERSFARTADFTIWVKNEAVDETMRLLASYRATPMLYLGSPLFGSMAVYGFFKEVEMTIQYMETSVLSLSLAGLSQ